MPTPVPFRRSCPIAAAVLVALAVARPAAGQPIDYAALEQLFGEPVTLSVTGKPQRATDAPANIDIITQDDIRRSGATDIPGVLQFVTGIDVRRSDVASADVGMRGYNQASNPRLMVLVDGRQVYMVDYGRILWATIPVQLSEIRQIEVIRGPNSALYGFNAVSGVINIITYDPLREPINTMVVSGGTHDYAGGSVVATGKVGERAALRLSLGGLRADRFASGPLTPDDALSRQNPFTGTFNADGRWQIGPGVEALLTGSYGDTRLSQVSPPGAIDTEQVHSGSIRAGVNADTRLGLISLSAYRNQDLVKATAITDALGPTALNETETVTVVQASDLVKIGTDHTVRFGLEWRDNADSSVLLGGRLSDTIVAGSVMWDWQILPGLSLTNAVRLDHVQVSFSGVLFPGTPFTLAAFNAATVNAPSFNSGLVWKPSDLDTIRLTAARGVQLPTLMEQALQMPAGTVDPVAYYGRPNLSPSAILSTEVDYDRTLPSLGATLRTALFAQRMDNIIAWPFGGAMTTGANGYPLFSASNVGYSTAAGFEIGLKGHTESGWRWNASYALAATTDHTTLNGMGMTTGIVEYAHAAPRHVVIAGAGYSRDRWEADLQARWQSSYLDYRFISMTSSLQPVTIDNYVVMNARVGYRVTDNLTLALTVQQFNQARIVETAGPPVERLVLLSATVRL